MPVSGSSRSSSVGSEASATATQSSRWLPCGRLAQSSFVLSCEADELEQLHATIDDLPGACAHLRSCGR